MAADIIYLAEHRGSNPASSTSGSIWLTGRPFKTNTNPNAQRVRCRENRRRRRWWITCPTRNSSIGWPTGSKSAAWCVPHGGDVRVLLLGWPPPNPLRIVLSLALRLPARRLGRGYSRL